MKNLNNLISVILALVLMLPLVSYAADEDRLSYPELEVAPRATERVQMEAKKEAKGRWFVHMPVQASSLLTLIAANMAEEQSGLSVQAKNDFDERVENANYVGGAWLFTSLVLAGSYKPYKRGFKELKGIKVKSRRDELTRERVAEEILYRPAKIAKALNILSTATQLYVSASLMEDATKETKAIAGLAAIGALTPIIFEHPWIANAENHKLYKKKIYGPIAGPTLIRESDTKLTMGYGITYSF